VVSGLVIPSPVVLTGLVGTLRTADLLKSGLMSSPQEALGYSLGEFWPSLVIAHLLGFGFAGLCYRRQVRFGASRLDRIAWPLFVLAFGLPGWIGYRFGRSWPVLEPCPACHSPTPRQRAECISCEREFPSPALTGTEVFA
jgi:hypothetical protein